jgi:hypothetical protein
MFVSSQTDSIFVTLTGFIDNAISFNFQSKNCGAEWRYLTCSLWEEIGGLELQTTIAVMENAVLHPSSIHD